MMTAEPHVLKGFLIAAILSAARSSASSALPSLSSVSTMDFVKPLARKERSESFYLNFSKASTALSAMIFVSRWEWAEARVAWPWFTLMGTKVTMATAGRVRAFRRKRSSFT